AFAHRVHAACSADPRVGWHAAKSKQQEHAAGRPRALDLESSVPRRPGRRSSPCSSSSSAISRVPSSAMADPAGHDYFEVEADVGVRAWGPTRAEAFARAALGVLALVIAPEG